MVSCTARAICLLRSSELWPPRSWARPLLHTSHPARHPRSPARSWKTDSAIITDRHVRDAEVLVEASDDRRQNSNQEAAFHPRHSSPPSQLIHPPPAGSPMPLFHIEDWILCVSSAKLREILVLPRCWQVPCPEHPGKTGQRLPCS